MLSNGDVSFVVITHVSLGIVVVVVVVVLGIVSVGGGAAVNDKKLSGNNTVTYISKVTYSNRTSRQGMELISTARGRLLQIYSTTLHSVDQPTICSTNGSALHIDGNHSSSKYHRQFE